MPDVRRPSNSRVGGSPSSARIQFGLRGLFLIVLLCSVVCALWFRVLVPAIQSARQRECADKLKQIGIALHAYHDVFGSFPAPYIPDTNGKPMTSWRAALFPYLIQGSVPAWYNDRLPWNAPSNLAPASRVTAEFNPFRCPSASDREAPAMANYVMIVDSTVSNLGQWRKLEKLENAATTIIVAEIADSDIFWTEPRDLSTDEMSLHINDKSKPSISSHHPHGAMVLFADGSTKFLDDWTNAAELRAMLRGASSE